MHFEISRALKPGKQLTRAQLSSSHFAEEPRIGAFTLRRGSRPLSLNETQMGAVAHDVKKHLIGGSIIVSAFDEGQKVAEASSWDVLKNEPKFVFTQARIEEGKKIEKELQEKLDSGEETLESLQAEVVDPNIQPMTEEQKAAYEESQKALEVPPEEQGKAQVHPEPGTGEHRHQEMLALATSTTDAQVEEDKKLLEDVDKVAETMPQAEITGAEPKKKGRKAKKENE